MTASQRAKHRKKRKARAEKATKDVAKTIQEGLNSPRNGVDDAKIGL